MILVLLFGRMRLIMAISSEVRLEGIVIWKVVVGITGTQL